MADEKGPERESEQPPDGAPPRPQKPPSDKIKDQRDKGGGGDVGGTRLERPDPWPDPPKKPGGEEKKD